MRIFRHNLAYYWFSCWAILLSFSARADTSNVETSFAGCDALAVEEKQANQPQTKEQRLNSMEHLLADLRKIVNEEKKPLGKSAYPEAFLSQCREHKFKILNYHYSNADQSTRDSETYIKVQAVVALLNTNLTNSDKMRVQLYNQAYLAFSKVIEKNPRDWDSKQDRISSFLEMNFIKWKIGDTAGVTPSDFTQFFQTTEKLIGELAKDPNAPAGVKITAYKSRARMLEELKVHTNEAAADWKKVLELDPKDHDALERLSVRYFFLKDYRNAALYSKRLLDISKSNPAIFEQYIISLFENRDFNGIVMAAKTLGPEFKNPPILSSRLARSYLELKMLPQAKTENTHAMRANKNDPFTRTTQALIYEAEGDAFAEKKLLSSAIEKYDQGFKLDPGRPILRKKMAMIIYEYRKEKNFEPANTAKEEMTFITNTLVEVIKAPELGIDGLEVLISASYRAPKLKVTSTACSRYEDVFGAIIQSDLVQKCAKAFAQTGSKSKAVELLTQAISSQKEPAVKKELKQTLLNLK